jgi:hypothetical protein
MIPTPNGYQNPEAGIAFIVILIILATLATLFPEKEEK